MTSGGVIEENYTPTDRIIEKDAVYLKLEIEK